MFVEIITVIIKIFFYKSNICCFFVNHDHDQLLMTEHQKKVAQSVNSIHRSALKTSLQCFYCGDGSFKQTAMSAVTPYVHPSGLKSMLIVLEIRKWCSQQKGDDHSALMCAFVKMKDLQIEVLIQDGCHWHWSACVELLLKLSVTTSWWVSEVLWTDLLYFIIFFFYNLLAENVIEKRKSLEASRSETFINP